MNRIYKAIFSKSKGCYVVVSELQKSAQKQKSNKPSLMKLTVASIILLPLITTVYAVEPRTYQALAGYIEGDIIYNNDGKELINLGEIKNYLNPENGAYETPKDSNTAIGSGSLPAGQNSVSFGSGNIWSNLGDFSGEKYFLTEPSTFKLIYNEQTKIVGAQYTFSIIKKDPETGKIFILTDSTYNHYGPNGNHAICNSYNTGKCSNELIEAAKNWNNLSAEEQRKFFEEVNIPFDTNIQEGAPGVLTFVDVPTRKLVNVSPGEISATSTEAVNGSQLYALEQKVASGGSEYLSVNASDEEASPSTSAKAIGAHSLAIGESSSAEGTNSIAIGHDASSAANNSIALGTESTVQTTDTLTADVHGVVSVGSSSQDNGFTRRIINVADGVNATDAATVGQIDKAAEDLLGVSVSRDTNGELTVSDIGQTGKTTVSDAIGSIKTSVDQINNGKFSESAKTSVTQIAQQAAQTAVEVTSSDNRLTVTSTQADDQSKTTYNLSITTDGTVSANNTGLITGGTLFSETRPTNGNYVLSNATTGTNLNALDQQVKNNADSLTLKANADASGINVANWQTTLGGGGIQSGSSGFVTGDTLYQELRIPLNRPLYILTPGQSVAQTLIEIDETLKEQQIITGSKLDTSLFSLSKTGKLTVKNLARDAIDIAAGDNIAVSESAVVNGKKTYTVDVLDDGTVGGVNDSHLVTGQTVVAETRISQDGTYVKAANSAAANLLLLDGQIASKASADLNNLTLEGKKTVSSLIDVTDNGTGHLNVDSSVDENGIRHITLGVNADGTVGGANDTGIVTGNTVEAALNTSVQNILTNISTEGSNFYKAIRNEAQDAVKVQLADEENALLLTTETTDNATTYTLGLRYADKLEEGGKLPVSNGLVFTELGKIANAEITDANVDAWQQKLGDGTVTDGDTGLVTGSTVAQAIQDSLTNLDGTEAGGAVAEAAQKAINVKAADGQTLLTVSKATEGQDGSNLDTYTIDLALAQNLSVGQTGLITADVLRNEVRPNKDGAHVLQNQTVGENLLALDTSVSGISTEINSLRDFDNLTETAVKNLNTYVANSFSINAPENSPLSVTSAVNDQTGIKTWTIDVNDSGKIEEGDTNLVTGDTVWEYVKDFTTGSGFATTDASNITPSAWHAKLGTQPGSSAISKTNSAFVSGTEVFNEVRVPTASSDKGYSYLKADNSAAENLIALDEGLSSLKDLSGLTDAGKDEIGSIAADAVKLTAGTHVAISQNEASKAWTISVKDTGKVAENDAELVTGDTVWSYVSEATAGFAATDAGNIETTAWLAALGTSTGTPAISNANSHFVTGAEIYGEVRPGSNGHYVAAGETTGDNLLALDKSLFAVNNAVFDAAGNLQLSKNDLSNLTDAGKAVISQSAQDAVKVSSQSAALVVTPTEETNSLNYVLSLKTTDEEGADETALVTSGTLNDALASQSGDFSEELTVGLAGKADIDAGNINLTAWQAKLADGTAVAAGNAGLVSGNILFTEVRPTNDGRFIQSNQTTADNLSVLDQNLGKVADADTSVINRTNWINALSGQISAGAAGAGFVTGNMLYNWVTPEEGSYTAISSSKSVAQNFIALDNKLGAIQQGSTDTSLGNLTEAGKDVIADIAANSVSVSGSGTINVEETAEGQFVVSAEEGSVTQNDTGLVTGGAVWDAIQNAAIDDDKLQSIVNEAITNNETFETAINEAVSNNENVQNAINNALTNEETVENLSVAVATGEIKADDSHAVSGSTVYDYLHSNTVAFGANASASGEHSVAMGANSVASGSNSGAIGFGNTAAGQNSFAVGSNNTIDEKAQNTFVFGSNVTTSAQNAVVLGYGSEGVDNAVSVGSSTNKRKVVNVAAGEVSEGSTDAVNGGQLYETNQAIANTARNINRVADKLQDEINRAAANAAAMAALHPLGLDEEHKWSAAAGVGHYSGEQALAIGVFYKPTENVMFNVAGSAATSGDTMVNAGMSYRFGAPSSYNSMTNSELKGKVLALSTQNDALVAQLESARIREDSMRQRVQASQDALEDLKMEIELLKKAIGLKTEKSVKGTSHED